MAAERRGSRVGFTALWAASVALVAITPISGGSGGTSEPEGGATTATSLGDTWGNLLTAARPSPRAVPAVERVVQDDVLGAPVPSLCGHPAGTLQDGLLQGPESGVVWVFTTGTGDIPDGRVAYGPLEGGPDIGAAVAVYCDQGGVAWPESVVLYGPGPEYLGHVTLSDLAPGRQRVESISTSRGIVTVRFTDTYAPDESGSRGRVDGTVELRIEDGGLVVGEPEFVDERPTAEEAVRAAGGGEPEALAAVATSDAAAELLRLVEGAPGLEVGDCSSPLAGAPGGARATCTLVSPDGVVAHLHLSRLRFAVWQLIEVALPPVVSG